MVPGPGTRLSCLSRHPARGAHAAGRGRRCRHRGGHSPTSEPPSPHHSPTLRDALQGLSPERSQGGRAGSPPARDPPRAGLAPGRPPRAALGMVQPPTPSQRRHQWGAAPAETFLIASPTPRAPTPRHPGFLPRFPARCRRWRPAPRCSHGFPFAEASQGLCRQPQGWVSQRDEFRCHHASHSPACRRTRKPSVENPDPAPARGTAKHRHVPAPSNRW